MAVEGERFRWRLTPGRHASVVVYRERSDSARLDVHLPAWRDPWLNISGFRVTSDSITLETGAANEPSSITSRFVASAIQFGLEHGFRALGAGQALAISYVDGAFAIAPDVT